MLETLHIKNLALIREEEISFSDGLNMLTGETGAGKSVVIGSVNLALGAKADTDMIRMGEDTALIELTFSLNGEQEKRVRELEIPVEEDHTLLITRKIVQGRSVNRVNGETVPLSRLRELAEILINIHGQNDHQALLREAKQKEILDGYCGKPLDEATEKMRVLWDENREVERTLTETDLDTSARERETDLLRYEINEIDAAALKEGEEEQLDADYRRMANARKIGEAIGTASAVLCADGTEETGGFADALGRARRELAKVMNDDAAIAQLVEQIDDMDSLLRDLSRSIRDAQNGLVFDEADFVRTTERLDEIRHLEDKFGGSVSAIMEERVKKEERLRFLEEIDERRRLAQERKAALEEEMRAQCGVITGIRREGAAELAEKIRQSLVDCNFLDVRFAIVVEPQEDAADIRADGWDAIRFDIQTNPGEAMRPLSAIASGGELSRVMLGIRTVLADRNDTPTLIFDEIDAGISGKTAWKVSEKLQMLAQDHQIICITHLPQIAAMADHHFLIEKELEDERTLTRIRLLSAEESTGELARLLSADEVTEEVLKNAAQLKERAAREKKAGGDGR
ncbi:MAG: DNA repair protein RecN [Lachnospiraceae bacterium]|nr:DNA repair protein RecN [Lachnospiraceae bacterium]